MRRMLILALLAPIPYMTLAQNHEKKTGTKPGRSLEERLGKLDDDVEDAVKRSDATFFEKYLADDYTGIGFNGDMSTKAGTVEFVRSGKIKYEALIVKNRRVRVFGDTAVITKEEQYVNAYSGTTDISGSYRITVVLVQKNGQWKDVAWQSTRVKEPQRK